MKNVENRTRRMMIADKLDVKHNNDGTEYYGMRSDSVAYMCVFHKHETCVAHECVCICHGPKNPLLYTY